MGIPAHHTQIHKNQSIILKKKKKKTDFTEKRQNTYDVNTLGILDNDIVRFSSRIMLILNFAFLSGRSKHGNARRASIGENCVLANHLEKNVK